MATKHKINTPYNIRYDTDGSQVGLTALRVDLYSPDQVNFPFDPLVDFVTLTEILSGGLGGLGTGVYEGSFTPATAGTWTLIASDSTAVPVIENKAGRIEVVQYEEGDQYGAAFNASTDSLEAISNKVDGVAAAIQAPSARGSLLM